MKRSILILFLLCLIVKTESLMSQSTAGLNQITPSGIFDNVHDRFGSTFDLADMRIGAGRYSLNTVNSVSNTCIAGYFKLHFESGSYLDQNSAARTVACQVFSDLSALINSPLSALSNTTYVNIYCNNGPGLGTGTPYYVLPGNPTNGSQGILDNQVWKTIITGVDAYSNLPVTLFIYNTGTNFLPRSTDY
ncbi:hypothetical protein [Aurantibacillus circumpalustris]|uniref:hypothetical protein n=1 Tax=Aurantibacillus circumpalustris TaxID=3036359 RepID=UPI00295C2599|nr:hypothetical protein [Aurantibacillus circumpalustris]